MTEKRFEIMVGGTTWDNLQDKELTPDENIDLLNKLFDENEQLKKDLLELHEICAYYEGRLKELKGDVE